MVLRAAYRFDNRTDRNLTDKILYSIPNTIIPIRNFSVQVGSSCLNSKKVIPITMIEPTQMI